MDAPHGGSSPGRRRRKRLHQIIDEPGTSAPDEPIAILASTELEWDIEWDCSRCTFREFSFAPGFGCSVWVISSPLSQACSFVCAALCTKPSDGATLQDVQRR